MKSRRLFFAALLPVVLGGQAKPAAPSVAQKRAALRDPAASFWKAKAPDTVVADVETSRGTFTIQLIRDWAPHGVDRFYNLARAGYYDDSRFYRMLAGYIAQWGIAGNGTIASLWARQKIPADSARQKNTRGTISFAQNKPSDRATDVFINLQDNPPLDSTGFTPIGRVLTGMEVVDSLYFGYSDVPVMPEPLGHPRRLYSEGNKYLDAEFPKLSRLVRITIRR